VLYGRNNEVADNNRRTKTMRTVRIKVYKFSELSESVKNKVIENYYKNENYSLLEDSLNESCMALLEENNCEFNDIRVLYSLGYGEGSGLCFTGEITKYGVKLTLSHNYRYHFASSVDMEFKAEKEEAEVSPEKEEALKKIYFDICSKLEKEGYETLEYRMSHEEFSQLSDENLYEYTQDGELFVK
jgi:hypothetical protein